MQTMQGKNTWKQHSSKVIQEDVLQVAKLKTKDIFKNTKSDSKNVESAQKSLPFHNRR